MAAFPKRTAAALGRPRSRDDSNEEIWKPMLDNISSGKRLPEKSLLVLGGTPDTQKAFLESISTGTSNNRRPQDRGRKPPVANQVALGYTYQDVLDTDQEDTLARLSLYLLANPSPSFAPLIKPYINPRTIPHMLIVILLDWNHPWLWVRQLRDWIRVLRSLIVSLDMETRDALEENRAVLEDKSRAFFERDSSSTLPDNIKIPNGPGEWDESLGIPLCVVCQNADKIESLERERGWKEAEFDYILQYMRTILLKHGASLIYTMPSAPGTLQDLIHAHLGIKSLVKQKLIKYQVNERDRVLVPSNWDSWAKIRILTENFDVEGTSELWSVDIDQLPKLNTATNGDAGGNDQLITNSETAKEDEGPSATSIYEETIQNPEQASALAALHVKQANGLEVSSKETQTFLSEQLVTLEELRREDENDQKLKAQRKEKDPGLRGWAGDDASGVVEEHIGPVQFNMGGIHVNADEMVKRLQDREANRASSPEDPSTPTTPHPTEPKMENEKLASFFAGLIKTNPNSPRNA